jgi:uncharacterized Zn-binding protein involved in type VI secretion
MFALGVLATAVALAAVPQGDLLANPGAEAGQASQSGETTVPIPGWTTTGAFTVVPYGGGGAPDFFTFPPPSESQRIGGGKNFFAGGFKTGMSTATQTVDVSAAAPLVDANRVTANLNGWLGGFLSEPDPGTVQAFFLDAGGSQLGSVGIGPVTPDERGRDLKFVQKTASAPVPAGTRSIRVLVTAVQVDGTYDDAYFDSLDLDLQGPELALSRRCGTKKHVTLRAGVPTGLKARSVTFRLAGRSHVDRTAPFTASFVLRVKSAVATATGAVVVNGKAVSIPGRLVTHCP